MQPGFDRSDRDVKDLRNLRIWQLLIIAEHQNELQMLGHLRDQRTNGFSYLRHIGPLESGRLVRLFDRETPSAVIYSLAYQEADAGEPKIKGFRDWMFEEVRATRPSPLRVVAAG